MAVSLQFYGVFLPGLVQDSTQHSCVFLILFSLVSIWCIHTVVWAELYFLFISSDWWEALSSTRVQIKQSTWVLNKKELSPHWLVGLWRDQFTYFGSQYLIYWSISTNEKIYQVLTYWDWCQHMLYVGVEIYWQVVDPIYIYISGNCSLFLLLVPPPPALCQLQFPTRCPWTQSKSS